MEVNSTNNTSGASAAGSQATSQTKSKDMFGSSDFMMMLLAQLKNQNPLEPMDDSQMMSQMAQLNSLSELQAINDASSQAAKSSEMGYASSLIGKNIFAMDEDGDLAQGIVDGFTLEDGEIYVQFDKWSVPLSWVQGVGTGDEDDG
jgi:flagellar basal-body rod modification protein FlgD